jgi:uncharacterized glyoxalase superfamily protein PhnB
MVYIYVPDVDATFKKALEHGATEYDKVETKFYGDRVGKHTSVCVELLKHAR